jgi:hypothetical protein
VDELLDPFSRELGGLYLTAFSATIRSFSGDRARISILPIDLPASTATGLRLRLLRVMTEIDAEAFIEHLRAHLAGPANLRADPEARAN